jgi:hypothetical protein
MTFSAVNAIPGHIDQTEIICPGDIAPISLQQMIEELSTQQLKQKINLILCPNAAAVDTRLARQLEAIKLHSQHITVLIDPITGNIADGRYNLGDAAYTARVAAAKCIERNITPVLHLNDNGDSICSVNIEKPLGREMPTPAQYIVQHFNYSVPDSAKAVLGRSMVCAVA